MDSSFNKVRDIDVSVSNEGKNLVIIKRSPYNRGGLYYLVVKKIIKDIKGWEIEEPVVMRFKVY